MTTLPKRWVSSFTILAFLTTSLVPLAPVYAGGTRHKHKTIHKQQHHQEESAAARPARAHRLTVEEVLQEPVQTTIPSSQSWLPDWLPGFVQNPLSTIVETFSSLLGVNIEKTTIDSPLSKPLLGSRRAGAYGAENRNVNKVHEDLSTGATHPSAHQRELRERAIEAVAFLAALPREAAHGFVKGVKYAVEHPGESLVLFLSAQVAAVSAFKGFQTQEGPMDALLSATNPGNNKRLSPLGNEFQIYQNSFNQDSPSLASLTNNNTFLVWADQTGVYYDVYGCVLYPNGTALGGAFAINQNTNEDQSNTFIAALNNGNAFVTWTGDQTGDWDCYGRVLYPNGTAFGNEFGINQNTAGTQWYPTITGLNNGNAFVVWWGDQTGTYDIYGRVFYPNGTALGNEFSINQNTTGNQGSPVIAALSNGNAFVVWGGYQTGINIYGRIFAPNGTALGNEFGINQNTTGNQLNPSIAALSNGNAFVAWQGAQTGTYNIYGRFLYPNGTALSNEFSINQNTTGNQIEPSVAALSNGNAFVAWQNWQTGSADISGQIFSESGVALSNALNSINQNQITAVGNEHYPSVTNVGNDTVFVIWQGVGTISGRILDASVPLTTTGLQTSSMMTTGLQTSSILSTLTTALQTFPPTASMKIPTTSSNDPYVLPLLLGTGGVVVGATCLGVSLLGSCAAVAGFYGAKKLKKHQDKLPLYGNTKIVSHELLQQNSPYSKAIPVKGNENYGNTATVNQELLQENSPYSKAIAMKKDEK